MTYIYQAALTLGNNTQDDREFVFNRAPIILNYNDRPRSTDPSKDASANRTIKNTDHTQKAESTSKAADGINGENYTDLTEAVKEIIKIYDPKVLAFGGMHNEKKGAIKTTGEYFSEIIPLLVDDGFSTGVIEAALTDDPQFQNEIDFLRDIGNNDQNADIDQKKKSISQQISKENTPMIYDVIEYSKDKEGTTAIFISLSLLPKESIDVRGSLSYEMLKSIFINSSTNEKSDTEVSEIICKNEVFWIEWALIDKNKCFTFTGADHNDKYTKNSYGDKISSQDEAGQGYFEVDMIVPDYVDDSDALWAREYAKLAPETGVKMIIGGDISMLSLPGTNVSEKTNIFNDLEILGYIDKNGKILPKFDPDNITDFEKTISSTKEKLLAINTLNTGQIFDALKNACDPTVSRHAYIIFAKSVQ